MRGGHAGGAAADHGDLPARAAGRGRADALKRQRHVARVAIAFLDRRGREAVLRVGLRGLDAVLLGDETLQRSNRDRGVDGAPTAGVFARRGTDAPADGRERIGRAGDEERVLVATVGDQLNVAPGVGRHRAPDLTLDLGLPVLKVGQANRNGHLEPSRVQKDPCIGGDIL